MKLLSKKFASKKSPFIVINGAALQQVKGGKKQKKIKSGNQPN